MTITIKITGLPSCGSGTIRLDGIIRARLGDLLSRHLPIDRQSLVGILFDHDRLNPGYVILVNGRNIVQLEGLDTIIKDNETVLIASQAVGG